MTEQKKTVTVTLDEPIEMEDGKTYSSLTFRRLKTKDLVAMDLVKGGTNKACAMYASMAGVDLPVFYEMGPDDFEKLAVETLPLMGKSARKKAEQAMAEEENQAEAETIS